MIRGELDKAIVHYKRAIYFCDDYLEAYYNLGSILEKKNDFVQAEKYLSRALELAILEGNTNLASRISARLKQYNHGKVSTEE